MAAKKKIVDPRPDWDTYFMEIALVTATRANCSRRKVAAVVVSENRVISTGYNGTPRGVKQQAFEKDHRALLAAQPTPPRTFMLNFLFDSMELTPESKTMLPEVIQVVRDRSPTEITVYGYADSSGTADYNLALSAERARAVARLLEQIDKRLPIEVKYFGDKVPLVPTPPGVREPRNRRAEIVIL